MTNSRYTNARGSDTRIPDDHSIITPYITILKTSSHASPSPPLFGRWDKEFVIVLLWWWWWRWRSDELLLLIKRIQLKKTWRFRHKTLLRPHLHLSFTPRIAKCHIFHASLRHVHTGMRYRLSDLYLYWVYVTMWCITRL